MVYVTLHTYTADARNYFFSKVVYLYCVAKENNDLLLYFFAPVGKMWGKIRQAKRLSN